MNGYVAETNATNIFTIKKGVVSTPHPDVCLPGITRRVVLDICRENDIPHLERNVSVTDVWAADEMFTTGTMGELSPVLEVDGRQIGSGEKGPMTQRLQDLHAAWVRSHGTALPF